MQEERRFSFRLVLRAEWSTSRIRGVCIQLRQVLRTELVCHEGSSGTVELLAFLIRGCISHVSSCFFISADNLSSFKNES
jgi:hypothetical protein